MSKQLQKYVTTRKYSQSIRYLQVTTVPWFRDRFALLLLNSDDDSMMKHGTQRVINVPTVNVNHFTNTLQCVFHHGEYHQ